MPGNKQSPQDDKRQQPDRQLTQHSLSATRYPMPPRLELAVAIGMLSIVLYSFQFFGTGSVLRIAAVGLLIASAAMVTGFSLGLIFGIPREAKRQAEQAGAPAAELGSGKKKLRDPNTNLIDISDWLTKIVVGVGLVELKKIPHALWAMSVSLSPGLRSPDTPSYANSSATCCLAIVLFFLVAGFLFGYIWTRLDFSGALNDADQAQDVAEHAEELRKDGRPRDAIRVANEALNLDYKNALALFTKARALKKLAVMEKPFNRELLQEALESVTATVKMLPGNGGPRYNMACYQALLGYDNTEVLKNLKIAIENNPVLKQEAQNDKDLESLRGDPRFEELVGQAVPPKG